jgi:hypothetical protein
MSTCSRTTLKHGIPNGASLLGEEDKTMPNNQPPSKTRIDAQANKALADLKKVTDAHPDLDLELKSVKDGLTAIKMDNHR